MIIKNISNSYSISTGHITVVSLMLSHVNQPYDLAVHESIKGAAKVYWATIDRFGRHAGCITKRYHYTKTHSVLVRDAK